MMQDIAGSGNPVPGPDTFSLEDYLEGKSTFPKFKHRVFIDQEAGAELGRAEERLEELARELSTLQEMATEAAQAKSASLVDDSSERYALKMEEVEAEIAEIEGERDRLRERIMQTSLLLHFQVKSADEVADVGAAAIRLFREENPNLSEEDDGNLYFSKQIRYTLTSQIANFCTKMTLSDGREVPPPSEAGAKKLVGSLIASESMRMMNGMMEGLSTATGWADLVDAGFPGGSPHVENVELGKADSEGRSILGNSSAPNADRPPF